MNNSKNWEFFRWVHRFILQLSAQVSDTANWVRFGKDSPFQCLGFTWLTTLDGRHTAKQLASLLVPLGPFQKVTAIKLDQHELQLYYEYIPLHPHIPQCKKQQNFIQNLCLVNLEHQTIPSPTGPHLEKIPHLWISNGSRFDRLSVWSMLKWKASSLEPSHLAIHPKLNEKSMQQETTQMIKGHKLRANWGSQV